jgi:RNA polymerase sigma-70 factor (ECF subfamily)
MPNTELALTLEGILPQREAGEPRSRAAAKGVALGLRPGGPVDETSLIRAAQAGSREAFDELVRRYDHEVLRLATNLVHRPEEARDVYQEAFLKVYKNLHRFRFECSFYTWLYRVVTNVCLDHLRRRHSRREEQAPEAEAATDGVPGDFFERQRELRPAADPERDLMGKEIGRHIRSALRQLSPRERVVFEMKHYHGLKLRAIGEILGTSEETVKNSLFRATQKLRVRLEGLL